MKLTIADNCPGWVRQNVQAAMIVMGSDPVRIGKYLQSLPYPDPNITSHWDRKNAPGIFKHCNLIVDYGTVESPWMTVIPNGGTMNRDELVKLYA